jgi:hypothetical protein
LCTFFDRLTPRSAINYGQTFEAAYVKRHAVGQRVKATLAKRSALTGLIYVVQSRGHQARARNGNFLRGIFLLQQNCRGIKANSALGETLWAHKIRQQNSPAGGLLANRVGKIRIQRHEKTDGNSAQKFGERDGFKQRGHGPLHGIELSEALNRNETVNARCDKFMPAQRGRDISARANVQFARTQVRLRSVKLNACKI